MKPEIVIEMIQGNLKMDFSSANKTKTKVELTDAEIIKRLKTPKKALTRYIFRLRIIYNCSMLKFFLYTFDAFNVEKFYLYYCHFVNVPYNIEKHRKVN